MAGHEELARPCLHAGAEGRNLVLRLARFELLQEINELLAGLRLDLEGKLKTLVKEFANRLEVSLLETARGHRWRTDADTARRHGRDVAVHCVFVEGDVHLLEHLLHLATSQPQRSQIPQHQVVLSTLRRKFVALADQELRKCGGVSLDLLGVRLELGGGDLLELRRQTSDLVVVRTTLQRREDSLVDCLLVAIHGRAGLVGLGTPPEEDHPRARATQRLVRRGRDNIAEIKSVRRLASGNQPADVRNVRHHERTRCVADLADARIIPITGVRRGAGHDQLGAEHEGQLLHLVIVDVASLRVDVVRQRLEVDGGGAYLLLRGVEAVRQVAA
mmetsp:Transcript_53782/g.120641  ORF Transcript_53782/g.120641 Transcript_53782/m.120641 type:complete len:331 (+) Transcript_53782:191-1183(+)